MSLDLALLENLPRCSETVGIGPIASQTDRAAPPQRWESGVLRKATDHRSGLLLTPSGCWFVLRNLDSLRPLPFDADEENEEKLGQVLPYSFNTGIAVFYGDLGKRSID